MSGRPSPIGEGYELVRLEPDEREIVLENLKAENTKLFKNCLAVASSVLKGVSQDSDAVIEVACALFGKLATSSYGVLRDAVDEKAHRIENGQG